MSGTRKTAKSAPPTQQAAGAFKKPAVIPQAGRGAGLLGAANPPATRMGAAASPVSPDEAAESPTSPAVSETQDLQAEQDQLQPAPSESATPTAQLTEERAPVVASPSVA